MPHSIRPSGLGAAAPVASLLALVCLAAVPATVQAQVAAPRTATPPHISPPKQVLGFNVGDDYQVANYTQLTKYWKQLERESDRVKIVDIGPTAEGRRQYMAVITSAANQKRLDHYRDISKRLALAEGLTDAQAHALAREGKSVIFMDGGLHATETVGSQAMIELAWQLASRTDEETMRLLRDDILLLVLANPDGMELVANWYMRESDPLKRTLNGLPRLYQKYVGHDNARDLFMSNQAETINMNNVMFREWYPQITHTHHQTGPAGAVVFMPPFRDPFNYGFDPLVMTELDLVGAAMHSRLIAHDMPGSAMRGAANYSTWFNGAMRTVSYFHNMVGLLTEIIGNPTPMEVPLVLERQLPNGNEPMPVAPQEWHFRRSIDYEMEYSRAVLDVASRYRETFLYNIYKMGANAIARGSEDHWTVTPKRIAAAESAATAMRAAGGRGGRGVGAGGRGAAAIPPEIYNTVLHDRAMRDARGYIVPADQEDAPTATAFVNVLIKNGITVLRATAPFTAAGKRYPANSFVVKTAQAARPFVLDVFEPQDHPDDFKYPGAPPTPPYDVTGWTLAFQMGIAFDRVLDGFDGPFVRVTDLVKPLATVVTGPANAAGYLVDHGTNASFVLTNRLIKAKAEAFWMADPVTVDGERMDAGALWIPATATSRPIVERAATDLGVTVHAVAAAPSGARRQVQPVRIGLYDQYGGLMPSGWTRWLFEQFEFPYDVVYPQTLDAGNLRAKYDVLVFTDGVRVGGGGGRGGAQPDAASIPAEYRGWLGRITSAKTIPELKRFVEAGGSIVTIGSATELAELLGVPVTNYLTEKGPDGSERPLPQEKFYVPGSLLRVQVDNTDPLAFGMGKEAIVDFDESPVFRLAPDAAARGTHAVATFQGKDVLKSGWAWGREYLDGGAAIVESSIGQGKVFLFGPEVAFRGQSHGTFKMLFNGLLSGATTVPTVP